MAMSRAISEHMLTSWSSFENRIPLKLALGGADATLQTTLQHMTRLNKTESLIFILLCVLCF